MPVKDSSDFVFPAPVARKIPLQERSRQRIDLVIKTTESMLEYIDIEEISIPDIAKKSGMSRASIYKFFPSRYVLLNHILEEHITRLMNSILKESRGMKIASTIDFDYIRFLSKIVAKYYNENKVTAVLVFSGLKSRSSYMKYNSIISSMGKAFFENTFKDNKVLSFSEYSEVAALATELSFTCMKNGYYREGYISPEICEESSRAVYGYLTISLLLRASRQ